VLNTIENTKGKPVMQTPTDAGEQKRTVPKVVADWFHDSVIRGRKEVFTDVVTLTPDMARLLLAANHENRVINKRSIETYVDDIKSGRWALNGESIKVATDGSLNDGQHRCWAVVEAGKSIKTAVTFGLPRDSRMTLDQGKSRTTADYLSIEGSIKNAAVAAGIARGLWFHRNDVHSSGSNQPTRLAVRAEYWKNEREINVAAHFVAGRKKTRVLGGYVAVGTAFVIARRIDARAELFFDQFIKGTELKEGDPILSVRNRFLSGIFMPVTNKTKVLLRAFDAWLNGQKLSKVFVRSERVKKAGRK